MNHAKTIERAGRILFGEHWKGPFEGRFGISNRALRRMLNGDQDVPEGLLQEVEQALHDHGHKLDELLENFV